MLPELDTVLVVDVEVLRLGNPGPVVVSACEGIGPYERPELS